jgi:hypothetical protein
MGHFTTKLGVKSREFLFSYSLNAAINCGFVVVSVVLFKHKNEQRKSLRFFASREHQF